ncbi:MAG: tetratricopeptide repeat protein [Novosphingobium sp.]|nr:tetratricopeptide repeat protein [Novosphingobium sp.]
MPVKPTIRRSATRRKACADGRGAGLRGACAGGALALGLLIAAGPVAAQTGGSVSQPVVQRIPGSGGVTLNAALARLGRNPRDVEALIDAGNAALAMGDVDAATGFYRRADQVAPGNPRVKAGLAGAMVRNGDPFGAIPLFDEAERAGALDSVLAADRGLAYDLVGDNASAQRYYRQALASGSNDDASLRLALSQAISGDRKGADATLAPMLQRQDKAAWRTRAFALAILGQPDEAVSIARTVLPGTLADGIAPYLRYMPRLTRAQQAAAANFGAFPLPSEIGRDDPRVAQFAPAGTRRPALASADSGLVPKGEPLGRDGKPRTTRQSARAAREAAQAQARAEQARVAQLRAEQARLAQAGVEQRKAAEARAAQAGVIPPRLAQAPTAIARTAPAIAARTAPPDPMPTRQVAAAPVPTAPIAAAPVTSPPAAAFTPPQQTAPAAPAPLRTPTAPAYAPPATASVAPGFDLGRMPASSAPTSMSGPVTAQADTPAANALAAASSAPVPVATSAPAVASPPRAAPPEPPRPSRQSLAEAFSEFSRPSDVTPAAGAVDLRRIRPARPKAEAPAKPPPPSHPSRIWVQVATGRDKGALGFDWRRLIRKVPEAFRGKKAFVSDWGQTNRLLTGPFESTTAANAFLAQLRRGDVDGSFLWTSPAGQVVDELSSR